MTPHTLHASPRLRGVAALALAACLSFAGYAWGQPAVSERMISVGSHRLQVRAEGTGGPAIVIDTGIGDPLERLGPIQGRLASLTRVVMYNRAGYGESEEGPLPRDVGREAAELRALLQNAGIPGPYVLVGHSLGALNVEIFASRHPKDVAAMVLLDPPPLTFILRRDYDSLGAMAERMTAEWQAMADAPVDSGDAEGKARAGFFRMLASEHREMFGQSAKEIEAITTFGDIPLVVIASGQPNPAFGDAADAFQRYWIEQSRALSTRSTRGQFVLAKESSHHIYADAPGLVVETLQRVVEQARTR